MNWMVNNLERKNKYYSKLTIDSTKLNSQQIWMLPELEEKDDRKKKREKEKEQRRGKKAIVFQITCLAWLAEQAVKWRYDEKLYWLKVIDERNWIDSMHSLFPNICQHINRWHQRAQEQTLPFDTRVEFWLKMMAAAGRSREEKIRCENWGITLHWIFIFFIRSWNSSCKKDGISFHFFLRFRFMKFLHKYSTINFGVRFLMLVADSFVPVFWDQLTNLNVNFTTNASIESMLLNSNGICMAADESFRLLRSGGGSGGVADGGALNEEKKCCVLNFQLFGVAMQSKQ